MTRQELNAYRMISQCLLNNLSITEGFVQRVAEMVDYDDTKVEWMIQNIICVQKRINLMKGYKFVQE